MKFIDYTKPIELFLVFLLLFIFSTKNAYAYLDPGTGSFILQMLAASALGGLFAIKTFWGSIKNFFANLFSKKQQDRNRKTASKNIKNDGKK